MGRSKKKSNRKAFWKNIIILFLILVILGAAYIYITYYYEKDSSASVVTNEDISDYTVLENKDSLKYTAVVEYNINVNINTIAHTFYGDNAFWVYIYLANENDQNIKTNPLDIPKNTIIRLPRLQGLQNRDGSLNPKAVREAKILSDSILSHLPSFF